jgi:CRISPR-associated protein Cas4
VYTSIVVNEFIATQTVKLLSEISELDSHTIYFVALAVVAVIVIDAVTFHIRKQQVESGVTKDMKPISIDGTKTLPAKNYISDIQGLAGRPDALIEENGYRIPVERKPFAKKVRERHVAQMLVYLRLVEEFEGQKPPYGYLILGPKSRRVRIANTEEKQEWLDSLLHEMRQYLEEGVPVRPTPHIRKCARCPVRRHCAHALLPVTPDKHR